MDLMVKNNSYYKVQKKRLFAISSNLDGPITEISINSEKEEEEKDDLYLVSVKIIPVEVLIFFIVVQNLIIGYPLLNTSTLWISILIVGGILTFLIRFNILNSQKERKEDDLKKIKKQSVFSCLCYFSFCMSQVPFLVTVLKFEPPFVDLISVIITVLSQAIISFIFKLL